MKSSLDKKEIASLFLYTVDLNNDTLEDVLPYLPKDFPTELIVGEDGGFLDPNLVDLKNAINKLPKYKGKVYRGVFTWSSLEEELRSFNIGNIWMNKKIISTSKNIDIAKEFLEGDPARAYFLIIESMSGRLVGKYTPSPQEEEVIFLPNTRFKVKKIGELDSFRTVWLKEI